MEKRAALKNIRRMTVAEKLAKLSATDTAYVGECIDQAVQEPAAEAVGFANDGSRGSPPVERSQQQECSNPLAQDKAAPNVIFD